MRKRTEKLCDFLFGKILSPHDFNPIAQTEQRGIRLYFDSDPYPLYITLSNHSQIKEDQL